MPPKQTAVSAGTVLRRSLTISARLFGRLLASCVNAATREHYMASEVKTDSELEIAYVLFIDTVGYSKLRINEQRELLDELNRIVRATHSVCASEAAGTLIRIPTGDGMVLVFSDRPDAPAECALEISLASKQSPHFLLRMGIHSGPVSRILDVNDRANAAGAGINMAQRVMSCGDAGHILLSKHAADDLIEYERWRPLLHEIGEHEVKHGVRVGLVNLYNDDIGNPELPACVEIDKKASVRGTLGFSGWRKVALTSVAIVAIITLAWIAYAVLFPRRHLPSPALRTVSPASAPSNNSIAVLPFDNLSNDKQNAYFADSVQDEILTNLAKVSGLKVISRTSVMQYRNTGERNLREIAKELGVAHILEGTVERIGDRIRLRAQLIDGRTDSHLWGEVYSGDLGDVFALESRLAQQIVSQLRAKLSPQEKAAIEEQPTADLTAYDLYVRAKALISEAVFDAKRKESLEEAVRLLTEATARDPAFFRAYYQLAHAHDQLYFTGRDRTAARLELANAAIQKVHRLHPDSGEAHLALAKHLYWDRSTLIVLDRSLSPRADCFLTIRFHCCWQAILIDGKGAGPTRSVKWKRLWNWIPATFLSCSKYLLRMRSCGVTPTRSRPLTMHSRLRRRIWLFGCGAPLLKLNGVQIQSLCTRLSRRLLPRIPKQREASRRGGWI